MGRKKGIHIILKGEDYSAKATGHAKNLRDISIAVRLNCTFNSGLVDQAKELLEEAVEEWFLDCTTVIPDHFIYSVKVPDYKYDNVRSMCLPVDIAVYSRRELSGKESQFKDYFECELERLVEKSRVALLVLQE